MTSIDMQQYNVRTDLALEAVEMAVELSGDAIAGVAMETDEDNGIKITRLHVQDQIGSNAIGKMIGHYVTLEVPELRNGDTTLQDRVATAMAKEFEQFLVRLEIPKDAKVLIVGLGNWNVTPDALGPIVVENVMVTRHFFELMPNDVAPGYRPVSAVSPGVLGITGIESSEIVKGIVDQSKPDLIIAIDALASKSIERVNTTIQIADTGIHPGSGIGNKRKGLTLESLGVKTIAIGVPTVLYAATIVNNTIDLMRNHLSKEDGDNDRIFGLLNKMSEQERLTFVKEVLDPIGHNMLVTPKEIDEFIEDVGNIIASGLNAALHDAIDTSNVAAYTH
ncbi:GPR endopeptidase [Paenibacillus endoradicis]|uniref:GPR endopeptidase n=1 Tax=Paenibacillus endoradicis TaxID=2972487 RepID=UPI0021593D36|nr:GPR endopeptidase [Paenibacillus endoradicis]MCR8659194.1 GPR endopeptidase [Paenibacillus endoradicis]